MVYMKDFLDVDTQVYIDDYLKDNGLNGLYELLYLGVACRISERSIRNLQDLCVSICCVTKCEYCPAYKDKSKSDSSYPCWKYLYDWILEQAQLINNPDKLGGT